MAEAIAAGLLRKGLVKPEQLVGSHPRSARREELYAKYGIQMFEQNRDAVEAAHPEDRNSGSIVILGIKPQRLTKVLDELKGSIHKDQVVVSVVAGAKIETIADELLHAAVVRTMPNTPAQIGEGVTAWTSSSAVNELQEQQVCAMLEALGKTVRVENERQIDMATALSATGPTYIFLVMEALIDAGVHMGFSRHVSQELVQQMILGSVLFRERVAQASCRAAQHGYLTRRYFCRSNLSDGERKPANGVVKGSVGSISEGRGAWRKEEGMKFLRSKKNNSQSQVLLLIICDWHSTFFSFHLVWKVLDLAPLALKAEL